MEVVDSNDESIITSSHESEITSSDKSEIDDQYGWFWAGMSKCILIESRTLFSWWKKEVYLAFLWCPESFGWLLHCFSKNWIFTHNRFHYDFCVIKIFPFWALFQGLKRYVKNSLPSSKLNNRLCQFPPVCSAFRITIYQQFSCVLSDWKSSIHLFSFCFYLVGFSSLGAELEPSLCKVWYVDVLFLGI